MSAVRLPDMWSADADSVNSREWCFIALDRSYPGSTVFTPSAEEHDGRRVVAACTSLDAMAAADRLLSGEAVRRGR